MQIDDAIAQLGQTMGLELKLDDNRSCRLVFDSAIAIDFEAPTELPDQLVMSCVVAGSLAPEDRPDAYAAMLQANLFGRGTGGGVLALDEELDEVLLQRSLVMSHTDLHDLVAALEQVLQFAEVWIERFKESRFASPQAPEPSPTSVTSMLKI